MISKYFKNNTSETASTLAAKVEDFLLQVLMEQSVETVVHEAKPLIDTYVKETFGAIPKVIQVETSTNATKMIGVFHEKFESVLNLVHLNIPIYLAGEAGTGKNVICQQVAEALELDFYFTNAVTQEYQLKGFTDAHGVYHETQFYKAFTHGGLFFLDEMDASVPEALIILNSALANGYFDFPAPIGKVMAHERFRVIAAGNTAGTGADIEYTGRYQLDASSLDRFSLIDIDYSPEIELHLTNGNTELCEFARAFRAITSYCDIKCIFSYRSVERINRMEYLFPLSETLKMALIKGLSIDDLQFIQRKFDEIGFKNKYSEALKALCAEEETPQNNYMNQLQNIG